MILNVTEEQKKLIESQGYMVVEFKAWAKKIIDVTWEITMQVIDAWNNSGELKKHRCSCGRILGKFNGQAEVKCPKCGKMNVIGVGKQCKS